MGIKDKPIRSKASGINGMITGIDKDGLIVTFTKFQDIRIPFDRIDQLLDMSKETREEIKEMATKLKPSKNKKE